MIVLKKYDLKSHETSNSYGDNVALWVTQKKSDKGYDVEKLVRYDGGIYKSTKSANRDKPTNKVAWQYQEPSNSTALYDNYPTTISKSSRKVMLEYNHLTNLQEIAFGNIVGERLTIEVFKQDNTKLFSNSVKLEKQVEVHDYWSYHFLPLESVAIRDYIHNIDTIEYDLKVKITLTPINGKANIGFLAMGRRESLGCTDVSLSINKEPPVKLIRTNGRLQKIGGESWWKKYDFKLHFKDLDALYQEMLKMDELDGQSSLFVGDDVGKNLIYSVVGLYNGYTIDVPSSTATISIYSSDAY